MEERTYLTVTALNKYIEKKFLLDPYLSEIYIKGEISNLKLHNNNNMYFSIKDENTRINAVWFGAKNIEFKDGDTVLIKSKVNFYYPRGEYNLLVMDIRKDRIGELYQKFLELKEKLEKEGLFAPQYKKSIPKFSQNIGVITAQTGAAIQDITRTIQRRFPIANINVYSTLVQGEASVQDIVKNIKLADKDNNDVIILGRGGGTIEDLWSFNTEKVIRAIFNCKTPIVTGIGHELNFNKDKLYNRINFIIQGYKNRVQNSIENPYFKNYDNIYVEYRKKILLFERDLSRVIESNLRDKKLNLSYTCEKIKNIDVLVKHKEKFSRKVERLEANSPLNILKKGYSITFSDNKKIVSIHEVNRKDNLSIRLIDGIVECEVTDIIEEGVK